MSEIYEGRTPLSEEKQLATLFRDIEKGQLDLIDAAAKRIIELDTSLLGVLFAITAFGKDFPPAYLKGSYLTKICAAVTLAGYLGATLCSLLVMKPRDYSFNRYKIAEMRSTLKGIIEYKSRLLRYAGLLFFFGSVSLSLLILTLILRA